MKKQFSNKWKASKQTRKQRKYLANASLSLRHKMLSSNLSEDLRKKYARRSFTLRKGDKVKVMRGEMSGKEGKVNLIDIKNMKVTLEGVQETKKDGTKRNIIFHPSKLQIIELNLDDKKRIVSLSKERNNKNKATKENKSGGKK
ncbi:50S ribosomal protein L24 [Candidatus Pacearchaeota archaeon]|nr:50S ribosomal protein L24 [Candidatus Pacearchaeota archaeon]